MFNPNASPEYACIPQHLMDSLNRYGQHGVPTGGFLRACLENNLMEAACRADDRSRLVLYEICKYLYNEMPRACRGTPQIVNEWITWHQGGGPDREQVQS